MLKRHVITHLTKNEFYKMNLYSIIKNHKMLMNWLKHEFLSFFYLIMNQMNLKETFFGITCLQGKTFFCWKKFPMKNFLVLNKNWNFEKKIIFENHRKVKNEIRIWRSGRIRIRSTAEDHNGKIFIRRSSEDRSYL